MKRFFTGFLCGAVIAFLIAAAGALFVTQSPIPFMSKIQSSSEEFAQAALKDKSTDPNQKLYAPGTTPRTSAAASKATPVRTAASPATEPKAAPSPVQTPAAAPNGAQTKPAQAGAPAQAAPDPAPATPEPTPKAQRQVPPQNLNYFISVGAYKNPDEAETIRARIAFSGLDSSVSRGQDGYYRVRIGPYKTEAAAQKALGTLKANDLPGQIVH